MSKKSTTSAKADKKTAPATFYLADLAKEMHKDPKAVRAKFRRLWAADDTSGLPTITDKKRWQFAETDRDRVTELITGNANTEADTKVA